MRVMHKLVAAVVMAVVLLSPALTLALATCGPMTMDGKVMHCPPGCPMMAKMLKRLQGVQARSNALPPCCKFESARPLPPSEAKTVVLTVTHEVALLEAAAVVKPQSRERLVEAVSTPPPLAEPQAKLCTFQI